MRIITGTLFGFPLGLGVAALLFSYGKVAIGTNAPVVVTIVGTFLGLLVGVLAMVRRRRGEPSAASEA
jgi:hypothetical protein